MENEVIIDGCNVAECKFYTNLKMDCSLMPLQNLACSKNPNCYFKQLQRAKAENDTLHITISKLKADLSQAETSLYAWKAENEKLKSRNKLYKKIIKENIEKANNNFMILTACIQGNLTVDEVKEHAKLNAKNDELKRKLKSYKQALEEISEIAYTTDFDIVDIQKIVNEVLND